jgi:hypothetical protein
VTLSFKELSPAQKHSGVLLFFPKQAKIKNGTAHSKKLTSPTIPSKDSTFHNICPNQNIPFRHA